MRGRENDLAKEGKEGPSAISYRNCKFKFSLVGDDLLISPPTMARKILSD